MSERENAQGVRRVIVAGGGTGGHFFPGVAVAEELRRRLGEVELLFVGTERGIEARVVPERGERIELLDITPLKGRGPKQVWAGLNRVPKAIKAARKIITRFDADLVIGVGGYAAGPVLAAAKSLKVPTALLEQNAHVGLTNRLMARFVGRAYLAFESTAPAFGKAARVLGNPVRPELSALAERAAIDPEGFESRASTLLVVGGSQGARALNDALPKALSIALENLPPLRIVHQTGPGAQERVAAHYAELGIDADVVPFISDMAAAYESAALVVARAGATTLAELAALGRPSLLVPYPFAADDHQTKNARAFERAGAAICLPQSDLSAESLAERIVFVAGDEARRTRMAGAARSLGRPDAAAAIVDDLIDWLCWTEAVKAPSASGAADPLASSAEALGDPDDGASLRSARSLSGYQPSIRSYASAGRVRARRPLVFQETLAWD